MTLRLLDRIATLVRADAHGVVDALEERSLLLRQCLREAELELLEKRARVEALGREEQRLGVRAARGREALAALDDDVRLALEGGREELARFAIRRLLPLRREVAALEAEGGELGRARAELAERLAAQEAELEELRLRVRARLSQAPEAAAREDALAPPPVDEEEVELELLRRRGADAAEGGTR